MKIKTGTALSNAVIDSSKNLATIFNNDIGKILEASQEFVVMIGEDMKSIGTIVQTIGEDLTSIVTSLGEISFS